MAVKDVYVSVIVNDYGITISVNPWSVYVPVGDTVAWIPVSDNITEMKIRSCPGKPPWLHLALGKKVLTGHPKVKARFSAKSKIGKQLLARKGTKNEKKVVKPYEIDLKFTDPLGNTRSASIDPDMVMDT